MIKDKHPFFLCVFFLLLLLLLFCFVLFLFVFYYYYYFLSSIRLTRSVMFKDVIAIKENGAIKI